VSLVDVTNPIDVPRIIAAVNEARKRERLLPTWAELGPALQQALKQPGELVDNLVPIFGIHIHRSIAVFRDVLVERYGAEYADDLWLRLSRRTPR